MAEEGTGEAPLSGEEHYKAQGSPMFSKLWSFDELEHIEQPAGRLKKKKNKAGHADFERPDNWPADTEVEQGRWVFWLPEGWAQGLRSNVAGKSLSCYMSPEGKRFWHKKDIEKFLGHSLPNDQRQAEGAEQGKKTAHADFERPATWPADTQVDQGTWVFWLPEGWAQGVRSNAAGKTLSCYMSPEGRRFWHKKDIEKFLGSSLPTDQRQDDGAEKGKKTKSIRYVTDSDAIPSWPEGEGDWLPKTWKIGFRQLPSGLHRIYIPPGKEDEGFLYHRSTVMEWLSGAVTSLSPFRSVPDASISGNKRKCPG